MVDSLGKQNIITRIAILRLLTPGSSSKDLEFSTIISLYYAYLAIFTAFDIRVYVASRFLGVSWSFEKVSRRAINGKHISCDKQNVHYFGSLPGDHRPGHLPHSRTGLPQLPTSQPACQIVFQSISSRLHRQDRPSEPTPIRITGYLCTGCSDVITRTAKMNLVVPRIFH